MAVVHAVVQRSDVVVQRSDVVVPLCIGVACWSYAVKWSTAGGCSAAMLEWSSDVRSDAVARWSDAVK